MEEKAIGLVTRTRPLTESSLIVEWLSEDQGRLSTVAKGARKPKSPFRGRLDLFFRCEFSFIPSRRSTLHTLKEVKLVDVNDHLRTDWHRLSAAVFILRLLEMASEKETPLAELYSLMVELLDELSQSAPPALLEVKYELKLLAELGVLPNLNTSKLPRPARALALLLLDQTPSPVIHDEAFCGSLDAIRQFLHGHWIYTFGRRPKRAKG